MRPSVVLAVANGAARPSQNGPALAAGFVSNRGGKRGALNQAAGNNRILLEASPKLNAPGEILRHHRGDVGRLTFPT